MTLALWREGSLTLADLFDPLPTARAGATMPRHLVPRRVVLYGERGHVHAMALRLHVDLSALGEADAIAPDPRIALEREGALLAVLGQQPVLRGAPPGDPAAAMLDSVTTVFGVELALVGIASLGLEYRLTQAHAAGRRQPAPDVGGVPDPFRQVIRWFITREDA